MSKPNDKPKVSAGTLKTAGRLMKYVTGPYKVQFIIVLICILMTSISSIAVSLSLRFLLDDYILPLVGQQDPNFSELYKAMAVLACIFILGVIASFIYNRMMVVIGQGVLKKVRDEMFEHMQTLPIRYFDQNTNGSIKSDTYSTGCSGDSAYDSSGQICRRKQRQVFYQTADRSGRCYRIRGRADERTEGCQGL